MKSRLGGACFLTVLVFLTAASPRDWPDRWVYVSTQLESDAELSRVEDIARTAAAHRLNGMLLSAGFDSLDLATPAYLSRLTHVKRTCDSLKIEVIPMGFGVGYGGGLLKHDRNLAAGLPVRGALFVAAGKEARFVSDTPPQLRNGGFEQQDGGAPAGFTVHGSGAAVDTTVAHSGKNSIRFANFTPENPVWLEQPLRVQPWRSYRLRCWVKTENAAPGALFHVWARAKDGRDLAYMEPVLPSTSGWKELIWHFNSWYAESVDFRIGIEEGRSGTVWVDDVQVKETGLVNVLRRPGTPVTVRNDATGEVYQEGRDFAPIADPNLNFRWDHDGPAIHLLTGSRIHDRERLRVDYYHGTTIYRDQVPIDMSEPAVYEIWRRNVALLAKKLAPRKYFLSMDEVRVGGLCQACKRRRLSMAQILGDCVTRQFQMIRDVNPNAEVWVWSDMFDPNHNAREQYYLIDGSFRDTVEYIPRDLHIACWYYEKRDLSLSFFSKLGYHTLGAAYYDADDLTNPRGWMESLARTPGAEGIMYTTWENKYGLLGPFGDLVAGSGLAPGR